MKKILLLFALCVLAFGCSDDNVQPPPSIPNTGNTGDGGSGNTGVTNPNEPIALEAGQLRVISFNIRTGTSDKNTQNAWDNRKTASPAFIKHHKPTVFGLQEALDFQISYLKSELPEYDCYGVGREDGKSKGEHMSIFYNKKTISLLKWGTFWLSETPDVPSIGWDAACKRTATWALMKDKKSGKKFYFVNTHLDHVGWEARKNGLALIVDRIESINPENLPMVLTGDFNMKPDRPEFEGLKKKMVDTRVVAAKTDKHSTFNGWGKDKDSDGVIDYIWYKGFSSCPVFETVTKPYMERKYISDHYPVKATLFF